jgi:hypothetical protein
MSHTGGSLPYQSGRMDKNSKAAKLPKPVSDYLKRMYSDTVSPHSEGMQFAIDYYGIDNVMYGTDYPCWDPAPCLKLLEDVRLSPADKQKLFLRQRPPHPRPEGSGSGQDRRQARARAGLNHPCCWTAAWPDSFRPCCFEDAFEFALSDSTRVAKYLRSSRGARSVTKQSPPRGRRKQREIASRSLSSGRAPRGPVGSQMTAGMLSIHRKSPAPG